MMGRKSQKKFFLLTRKFIFHFQIFGGESKARWKKYFTQPWLDFFLENSASLDIFRWKTDFTPTHTPRLSRRCFSVEKSIVGDYLIPMEMRLSASSDWWLSSISEWIWLTHDKLVSAVKWIKEQGTNKESHSVALRTCTFPPELTRKFRPKDASTVHA